MLVKSKVKYIQSLSHKKQRDQDGVFIAEGPKIINELLASGGPGLVELYALPEALPLLPHADTEKIVNIDESDLQRISFLSTPNQALAIFRQPSTHPFSPAGVALMLDGIQDPGNMGTIIRCADWFGITQVVCSRNCADVFSPKTIQSTMASIARVNVIAADLPAFIREHPLVSVYAATLDGESVYDCRIGQPAVIVIGNESRGVSPEVLALAKQRVTIPGKGRAESLNAAVATGIILSHVLK